MKPARTPSRAQAPWPADALVRACILVADTIVLLAGLLIIGGPALRMLVGTADALPPSSGIDPIAVAALTAALIGALARTAAAVAARLPEEKPALPHRGSAGKVFAHPEPSFRTLADALPDAVWLATSDGRCHSFNRRWTEYTGQPVEGSLGTGWLELVHPDDRQMTLERWKAAAAHAEAYDNALRLRGADGRYRWFLVRSLPVRDAAGQVAFWIGTCTDIHERQQAVERLVDADRQKDTMLATIAHELRNPLAPLNNVAYLLARSEPRGVDLARAAQLIRRQVDQMARMLDDLVDAERMRHGKLSVRCERVRVREIVNAAVAAVEGELHRKQQRLEVDVPVDLQLYADPVRLTQVVSNLLSNAVRYTDVHGRVTIRAASGENGRISIAVADSGIGLRPEERSAIFELFAQVASAHGTAGGGLGIGLAIVKGIVELHGGTVSVDSDGPGRGSRFVVELPAVAAPCAPPDGGFADAAEAASAQRAGTTRSSSPSDSSVTR